MLRETCALISELGARGVGMQVVPNLIWVETAFFLSLGRQVQSSAQCLRPSTSIL